MINIIAIMLAVVALDGIVAAAFFATPWPLLAVLPAAAAPWLARRWGRGGEPPAVGGWLLGPAAELSNPDRPTRDAQARLSPATLNLGFLVIGSPGAGKTESVELGFIRSLGAGGWAFFEGKGDIDIYKKCVAMGRPPDYFFSSELPGSASINLMAGEPHDVVDRLGKILIGSTQSTTFYADEQRAVLTRIVPLLLALPEPANLRDLYVVLYVEDAARELVRRAKAAGADPVEVSLTEQWLAQPASKRLELLRGLLNRLFIFVAGPYADRLNAYQPDIVISTVVREQRSLYLHLPLTDFARDVAIAIVESFGVEARKRQLAGTDGLAGFPLILDDWGAFFHEGFGPFSARCRSAAMPLSFGFQSRAQLDAVSPTYADELDDTIATKIIMRVQGEATAQYAARLLGQYEAHEVSTSQLGERDGSNVSYLRRDRIEARQLRELQPGEAFVSTLTMDARGTRNPLWRLRFPRLDFTGWRDVPLPAAHQHAEGEGLGLWGRYMQPATLATLHAELQQAERETRRTATGRTRTARDEARAQLASNPGLDIAFEGGE